MNAILIKWVNNIRDIPDLSFETEQRLFIVLTQLIEQKFKTLTYKELSKMLRLTPFEETITFRETYQKKLREERTQTLVDIIRLKFSPAERTMTRISKRLIKLDLENLKILIRQMFVIDTLKQLNTWIEERIPSRES